MHRGAAVDPTSTTLRAQRAWITFSQGDSRGRPAIDVIKDLDALVADNPRAVAAFYYRAQLYGRMDDGRARAAISST